MGLVCKDDGWRLPDELWAKMEPLLPPRKPHPLGCHRSRVPDRIAMNAILRVLRTGMQWNALNGSGICWGKKPAPILRIAAKAGSSAVC